MAAQRAARRCAAGLTLPWRALCAVARLSLLPQVPVQLVPLHQGLDVAEGPGLLRFARRRKHSADGGAIERGGQAHPPDPGGRKIGERERSAAYPDHEVDRLRECAAYAAYRGE